VSVSYFDYRPAYLAHRAEFDAAIARVLASGHLILGPEGQAFEREFASYTGSSHAVGVNSGTDALTLALRALEVGAGDEVLTVANAGAPPVAAIRAAGATPRFVDVLPRSLVMDPSALEQALTSRSRCVLPVHLYGHPAPLDEIATFAERHGLHLIEDCAQAHGAISGGRHVGTHARVGCFSFYPTKNLGAFGDGGMCVTDDADVASRLRALRQYGFDGDRHAHIEGVNSRLDELQAAILRVRLQHLDDAIRERRRIAEGYANGLRNSPYEIPSTVGASEHAYHLFVVRTARRDRVVEELRRREIGFGIHYPDPAHLMEAYRGRGFETAPLPVTEQASREVLSLPIYEGLPKGAVSEVVTGLLDAL
jgi:dTDP-4-amino-4,6-dideoxygalactose transaminase